MPHGQKPTPSCGAAAPSAGSWQNFVFLGELRGQDQIRRLRLDFVVQARNFREMPDAVDIARAFGFD